MLMAQGKYSRGRTVLTFILQVVLQLVGYAECLRVVVQHGAQMLVVARAGQSQQQRHLEGWHRLVADNIEGEVKCYGMGMGRPLQFLSLTSAERGMGLGYQPHQFHVVALCQQAVTHAQQRVTHIDGVGIAIEGIDGGLVIAGHVAVLNVIVDERSLVETLYGNSSTMHILVQQHLASN